MKNITDSYINKHLKKAVSQILPDKAKEIWELPVEKAVGNEWFLDGLNRKIGRAEKAVKVLSAAAACFAVGVFAYYMAAFHIQASVYLDVNPAVQFELNSMDRVIRAKASNQEGEQILKNLELSQTDLNTAVQAVLNSMAGYGYLDQDNMVLLSVDSRDRKKGDQIRKKMAEELRLCLDSLVGRAAVLDQEVYIDEELEKMSQMYKITPGKAALIQKITNENSELNYAKLAGLPLTELAVKLSEDGIDIREYADYSGEMWDIEALHEEWEEEAENEKEEQEENSEKKELKEDQKEEERERALEAEEKALESSFDSENEFPESDDRETENEMPEYEEVEAELREPEHEEPEYELPEPEDEEQEDDPEEEED